MYVHAIVYIHTNIKRAWNKKKLWRKCFLSLAEYPALSLSFSLSSVCGRLRLCPVLRIRDVDPGSWFLPIPNPGSRIPGPGSKQKQKGERSEKKFCPTFFKATNITKFKIILFLCWSRKTFRPIYKELRIIELFIQNIVIIKLSKI